MALVVSIVSAAVAVAALGWSIWQGIRGRRGLHEEAKLRLAEVGFLQEQVGLFRQLVDRLSEGASDERQALITARQQQERRGEYAGVPTIDRDFAVRNLGKSYATDVPTCGWL